MMICVTGSTVTPVLSVRDHRQNHIHAGASRQQRSRTLDVRASSIGHVDRHYALKRKDK
jgi:hypothetical protein